MELEPQVLKNLADFQAFALCVEALQRIFWREALVVEQVAQAANMPLERGNTSLLIHAIAERDHALVEALSKDWDKGRFPDSEAKSEPAFNLLPKDQFLFAWAQAAKYSASLASSPDRFHRILETAKPK